MRMALLPPLMAALATCPWPAHAGDPHTAAASASAHPATAPAAVALTLSQAHDLALSRHPDLAVARSDVAAAAAARVQAGARPDPVVEAELEDTRRETSSTTLLLTQPIELGGKRAARVEVADRAFDIARSRLAARRAELKAQVSGAFFDAVAAQQRVELAQASLELAEHATDVATRRVTAGKVSPLEQTKAQVAQAGMRIELQHARSELRTALRMLGATLGDPRPPEHVDAGSLTGPRILSSASLERGIADAPLLRQARLEVDRLGAALRLERANSVPDVTVGLGAKHAQELGRTQALITLSVPLPVFDRRGGAELEALRRQDAARHALDAVTLTLRAEVFRAHERLLASVAEADALQADVLTGAQSAFDGASKGFELGKFGFLEVLDAQRTLIQARSQHLRAVAEAHRAEAEILRLLGTDDVSDILGQQ